MASQSVDRVVVEAKSNRKTRPRGKVKTIKLTHGSHVLTTKTKAYTQRHSLFQSRCNINGNVCNDKIDGGSNENTVSQKLETPLNLRTNPNKVCWIK